MTVSFIIFKEMVIIIINKELSSISLRRRDQGNALVLSDRVWSVL